MIAGKIHIIRGEGDTVEIVDSKTERKPDVEKKIMKKDFRQSPECPKLCAECDVHF